MAVELADGRVYVNAREHNGSDPATRTIAYSSDGGQTFDAPFAAEPNITSPVVQNSLVRLTLAEPGDRQNVSGLLWARACNRAARLDDA